MDNSPFRHAARMFSASVMALAFVILPASPAASEIGLTLTPSHLSPTMAVGDTTSERVLLTNNTTEAMTIRAAVELLPGEGNADLEISVEPGVITLEPDASAPATVEIIVPPRAAPGRKQALVRFDVSPASGRDVAIVGGVAALVDLRIIEPVDEVSWTYPRFIDSMSDTGFSLRARNAGNFSTDLTGTVELSGPLATQVLSLAADDVAVGETVDLEIPWTDMPVFAVRKATLSVTTGTGEPVREETLIVIFPWKASLTACLLLVAPLLMRRVWFRSQRSR